jgi:hypothetical protein
MQPGLVAVFAKGGRDVLLVHAEAGKLKQTGKVGGKRATDKQYGDPALKHFQVQINRK